MSQHKEQLGFLTFAKNSEDVDYLKLAYLQALNVKATQKNNKFAVVVDPATNLLIEQKHKDVFDYIIVHESNGPFDAEPDVFWLTPFKETIKLESDLLLTRSIDHWINAFRLKDIVLSTGCKKYDGTSSKVRTYRKLFDDNNLPDVYNGLMYFRYSRTSMEFFTLSRQIRNNWKQIKDKILLQCNEDEPSTDVLYAVTAKVIGIEQCTIPSMDFVNFVHMKPAISNIDSTRPWYETLMFELDGDMLRINNLNQYYPVHYYDKNFASDDIIKYYEQRSGIN
jgi:hypothetical protein